MNVNLRLKKAAAEFVWWGGVEWWWWWGLHSPFLVQPNYSVEVVLWLCCVVVGVVSIIQSEFFDVNYI